jgi:hypothetical protein
LGLLRTGINGLCRNEPARLSSTRGSRMPVEPLRLGFCLSGSVHTAHGWIRVFSGFSVLETFMSDDDKSESREGLPDDQKPTTTPPFFTRLIFMVFAWVLVGLCFIYGVRMWFNSTIASSFIPLTGAAFSAVLSFTLVLALQYTTGPIKIKFSTVDFEGASGPIIFWCVCFFVISYGLYMMGLADVVKVAAPGDPRSVLQLFQKQ